MLNQRVRVSQGRILCEVRRDSPCVARSARTPVRRIETIIERHDRPEQDNMVQDPDSDGDIDREVRSSVRKLCEQLPNSYWRDLDRVRGYPQSFVDRLIRDGFLNVLIPEQYGGGETQFIPLRQPPR
jgi:alkylation response protein AidB-like acyl-CoA dehydrogenase